MTAELHVIVGAGPIGTALARQLANAGNRVRVVTRSGGGPEHPSIERRALDATNATEMADAAHGAVALYNCANPGSYMQWERAWPPLAAAILSAAERSGAVLVTLGNLYGYGPVDAPMTPDMPLRPSDHKGELRARMWRDALAAHETGRVRATEARASDYIGPTAPVSSSLLAMYANATLAGKSASVFGDPDQPHTWTAVDDIAATLTALAVEERAWGRPWIVPSNPAVSIRAVLTDMAEVVDAGVPRLRRVPRAVIGVGGLVVPILREVGGVLYQFERPFLVDASATTEHFGVTPTPWETLVSQTALAWHARTTG